jgi:hypothetical protein
MIDNRTKELIVKAYLETSSSALALGTRIHEEIEATLREGGTPEELIAYMRQVREARHALSPMRLAGLFFPVQTLPLPSALVFYVERSGSA